MRGYKIPQRYDLDQVSSKLDALVSFLNFDFARAGDESFAELRTEFKQLSGFEKFPDRKMANDIQRRLLGRIVPIIGSEKKREPWEAARAIARLLKRVEKNPLRVLWGIWPIEYDRSGKKLTSRETRQEISRAVLFGDSIFDAAGFKWVLGEMWQSLKNDDTFEDMLYFTFCMHILRSGLLGKLKTCKKCTNIFVQTDPRKEFCSSICKDALHNKRRAEADYFNKRRRRQRLEQARRGEIRTVNRCSRKAAHT